MRIAIGADHAGYPAKEPVKEALEAAGHEVVDLGAHEYDALDDYPDFAKAVAEYVAAQSADRGSGAVRQRRGRVCGVE